MIVQAMKKVGTSSCRRVESLDQGFHAMAAEVGEQRRQRGVVMLLKERFRLLAEVAIFEARNHADGLFERPRVSR